MKWQPKILCTIKCLITFNDMLGLIQISREFSVVLFCQICVRFCQVMVIVPDVYKSNFRWYSCVTRSIDAKQQLASILDIQKLLRTPLIFGKSVRSKSQLVYVLRIMKCQTEAYVFTGLEIISFLMSTFSAFSILEFPETFEQFMNLQCRRLRKQV